MASHMLCWRNESAEKPVETTFGKRGAVIASWRFSQGGCISEPFRLVTKFLVLLCLLPREYQRMSVGESRGASCDQWRLFKNIRILSMQPFLCVCVCIFFKTLKNQRNQSRTERQGPMK